MAHGPEHQIEHAEHAAHASHSGYDKRVTISIAIIAAVLACVTMLGHRAHNKTLQLQTLATRQSTEASNKWNYYQTKNVFHSQAEQMLDQLTLHGRILPDDPLVQKYQETKRYYDEKLPKIIDEAKEIVAKGEEYLHEAAVVHARADRFDYSELALQLAVVLCSLAILTKGHGFWYVGIASALVGVAIALTGVLDLGLVVH